jgi:hypothetical protein
LLAALPKNESGPLILYPVSDIVSTLS